MQNRRYTEIDLLKCLCILTVVYIHSISTSLDPANFMGYLANDVTRFAVPGLFIAAAFLFDKKKGSIRRIATKKLIRLLPPYLFCSLCFQILNVPGLIVRLENIDLGRLFYNLFYGDTFGIYYFVFVLFYLFVFSLVLRYIPNRLILGLWGLSAVLLVVFVKILIGYGMSFFAMLRHPFFHLFAYLTGWVFSLNYEMVSMFTKRYRLEIISGGIVLISIIVFYTRMGGSHFAWFPILTQLYIYLCLMVLITIGMWMDTSHKFIRFFSESSYGIYLLHFPIVKFCQSIYPEISAHYSFIYALISWSVGVAGSILIIVGAKKIAGSYSKYMIGC